MSTWVFQNPFAVLFFVLFLAALGYLLWLRYRISVSKARFALAAIATMASCVMGLLTFLAGPMPIQLANVASRALGLSSLAAATDGPGWFLGTLAFLSTVLALWLVYRFSVGAIESWEGPVTVNVSELAKREQDNNLSLLAFAELRRLAKLRGDPKASDDAVYWRQRQADAPNTPSWHLLARDLFTTAYTEAQFDNNGWRDRFQLWVGRIHVGHGLSDLVPLVLLLFDQNPSQGDIETRLAEFRVDSGQLFGSKFFAVSYEGSAKDVRTVECFGASVEVLPRRFLLRKGLRLTGYARDLVRRFDVETLGGTTATLAQTFVEAHVRKPGQEDRIALSTVVSNWVSDTSRKHLAITGEYGQGKSTAMLDICVKWAKRYLANEATDERIPLLIELRGQNPAETDPVAFLSSWTARYPGTVPQELFNLIKAGEAIVIFEGFDELRNAGRAYDRHEHFNALWRMAFPGTKLLFTGRPNFFLDEREKNRTLRSDSIQAAGGGAFTELWELERLTNEEVEKVARGFGSGIGVQIVAAAKAHPAFSDIVSRPSMLPVVATIWRKIASLQAQGHDLTGAILIEYYLQAIYQRKEEEIERDRRDAWAPDGASYLLLPREVREIFTLAVVWRMAGSDARNTISRRAFNAVIAQIYDEVLKAFQKSDVAKHLVEEVRRFEERFKDESRSDRLERVSNEIASAGLFVSDPAGGPSNLRLPHKQFYEYLIAKACWIVIAYPDSTSAEILKVADSTKSAFDKILSEELPLGFISEILEGDLRLFGNLTMRIYFAALIFDQHGNRLASYLTAPVIRWFGINRPIRTYRSEVDKPKEVKSLTFKQFLRSPYIIAIGGAIIILVGPLISFYLYWSQLAFLEALRYTGSIDPEMFSERMEILGERKQSLYRDLLLNVGMVALLSGGLLFLRRVQTSRFVVLRRLVALKFANDQMHEGGIPLLKFYTACARAITDSQNKPGNCVDAPQRETTARSQPQVRLQEMIAPVV